MPNIGVGKGLAYRNDWAADTERAYQSHAYAQDLKARNEEKAALLAEKMKPGHAYTPFGNQQLQSYYEKLNDEVADFYMQHGDNFMSDIGAMQEFNRITDQYLNNDIIRREEIVKQEHGLLLESMTNQSMKEEEINAEVTKYDAYANQPFGSEQPVAPYVFTNPKRKGIMAIFKEGADMFELDKKSEITAEGQIWDRTVVDQDKLANDAINLYVSNKFELDTEYKTANKLKQFTSVQKWVEYGILTAKSIENIYKGGEEIQIANTRAKASSEEGIGIPYHVTDITEKLRTGEIISPHPANAALTRAGAMDKAIPADASGMTDITLLTKDNPEDPNAGKYNHVNVPFAAIVTSMGEGFIDTDGIPKFKTRVFISIPEVWQGKNSKYADEIEKLKSAGFVGDSYYIPGMINEVTGQIEGANKKAVGFSGWVLEPMIPNGSNLISYDKIRSGSVDYQAKERTAGWDQNILRTHKDNPIVVSAYLTNAYGNQWKQKEGYVYGGKMNGKPVFYDIVSGAIGPGYDPNTKTVIEE